MAIKVYGKNTPALTLGDKEFLASGGEADVYVKNGVVLKLYHDLKKTIPQKKIDELSALTLPSIIKPEDLLMNEKGLPVGYTMKFVQDTVPLPKLFTTSFLTRNNIAPTVSEKLVENMMQAIDFIHTNNVLIVDLNEFNVNVDGATFDKAFFLDVDSYQTPSFPATALMESVRDWTTTKWTMGSDWFSFAVLACQLFIGIHPFKGKHPTITGLKERVLAGKSVFNKTVDIPPTTRDFSLIPQNMMAWFEEVFEKGKRLPPPQALGKTIIKAQVTTVHGGDKLIIDLVGDFGASILGVNWVNGRRIAFLSQTVYVDKNPYQLPSTHTGVVEHNSKHYYVDTTLNGTLSIREITTGEEQVKLPILARRILVADNRVYVINSDKISEVVFTELSGKIHVGVKTSWGILPSSWQAYRGFVMSDVLGLPHAYIPFKAGSMAILALPELKGYKVLDAKYENQVLIVVGASSTGEYDEFTFRVGESHTGYLLSTTKDITPAGVNFVSLPNGVFVSLTGDGNLEVGTIRDTPKKVLAKAGVAKDASLCHNGLEVHFYSGTKLYTVKMK